jgi:hypothetical protein
MGDAARPVLPRGPAIAFGAANVASSGLVALGLFAGLSERNLVVDAPAVAVTLLLFVSGVGLVSRASWGRACARVASGVTLVVGLALIAALAFSASFLAGIYGPVGQGGAVILTLVMALVFPYLVALPGAELYWLGRA